MKAVFTINVNVGEAIVQGHTSAMECGGFSGVNKSVALLGNPSGSGDEGGDTGLDTVSSALQCV